MNKLLWMGLLVSGFMLAACGSKEPSSPELTLKYKKQALEAKKGQLLALNQEISQLQAEIEELDPETKLKVRQTPVTVSEIEQTTFQHFVEVQGKVEANKNIQVSSQMAGRITQIKVQEGQRVRKGQLLAQLDDAIMKSSIEELKTSLELATIMFNKQENLWKQEIGTEIQFLTAKNQKESLEKRLVTLNEQLSLHKIYSPISGSVDEILPKIGETVSPGFPAFRIVNNSDLSLKADLSEAYAPYIRKGDVVKVQFPSLNREINGKVSLVGSSIDANDRTFRVEVRLPSDQAFKPNMYGQLSINDQTREEAISIPFGVVQYAETGPYVFIAEASEGEIYKAKQKKIELGLSTNGQIEVVSGLSQGDFLIIAGYKELSDGQEVVVTNDPENSLAATK
ncbi:MAG: efflux RND transporter periplasmic adaptor subunit [Bacteroidota bacterium]